ncbi:MAG: hypothetical protein FWD31_13305, partial [Planctomycetaceae bacterium]|nr:hypothetical protein [Planctomycetaceae bacterium]
KSAKSIKDKKKAGDDVSSKGCFWLIILFFILVTAGMIGGLFWLYSGNVSKDHDVTTRERNIENQQKEIDALKQQIENDKSKYAQIDNENTRWEDEKGEYERILRAKDDNLNRVADYFSLFPQVSLPPMSVKLKDGIPRKDDDAKTELLRFVGALDRKWNVKDMFSVNITCTDDMMTCQSAGPPVIYQSENLLLGYPWRLYAQRNDESYEPIAEFELLVTESGISVRRFHDELWNRFVETELEKWYEAEKKAAFGNNALIERYEANFKDKPFVLDEAMLKKIGELGPEVFADEYADVARLIELRKNYFTDSLTLKFVVDVELKELTDFVKRANVR